MIPKSVNTSPVNVRSPTPDTMYCFFVLFVVWVYYHIILSYILLDRVHGIYLYKFLFVVTMHTLYTTKTASNI